MPTVDYIKQLESENEELRQRLSSAESLIANNVFLNWTEEKVSIVRKGKETHDEPMWFLQIGKQKIGMIRRYFGHRNNILYGVETFSFDFKISTDPALYEHIEVQPVDYAQMFKTLDEAKKACESCFSENII